MIGAVPRDRILCMRIVASEGDKKDLKDSFKFEVIPQGKEDAGLKGVL